ncbi:cytochrome P450 [Xylariaceae sp. FL0662B]|nr:cytochrome P450 [Xylariaceae sp. FL0662B]
MTMTPMAIMMTMLAYGGQLLLLGVVVLIAVYYIFLLPPKYPQNIPTIPFWVALLPFFKDVDQSEVFRKYIDKPLRTHGAVKLFFGAQWNVLVHRPSYIVKMFKEEDLYQKSGNQKKIPHSVLAQFLGDNIISSHGPGWKNYQSVIKPGLQRNFEVETIKKNADRLCLLLRQAQTHDSKQGIAIQDILQRYSVANCSEALLQTDLNALSAADSPINVLQTRVKREIFKPIFMNFPFLDRFPFPSRTRARRIVDSFKDELKRALLESHKTPDPAESAVDRGPLLGKRLLDARESGQWGEKQLLDNLTVIFVAGQENPQLALISTLYLLAKHPEAQASLYHEITSRNPEWPALPDQDTLVHDMPFLTAVIYESLRLFPPIGQLINRRAAADALLDDGVFVPAGTYLGYNCYSTNRDPVAWGPTADAFDPARWGASAEQIHRQYRQRRARGEFISFHGGRRACLGEKFALLQMRVTLLVLCRSFTWTLDPTWADRMTPAGPLYPRALRLNFVEREEGRLGAYYKEK